MNLKQKISEDFLRAFKEKDVEKKNTLSMIQSEIKNMEIELGKREKGLEDEQVVAVLQRAIKQRKDALQQFLTGGRQELAEKEQREVDFLMEYLPEQLGDDQIKEQVQAVIEKTGAQGPNDLGMVMGMVMSKLKGKVDGSRVQEIVISLLDS